VAPPDASGRPRSLDYAEAVFRLVQPKGTRGSRRSTLRRPKS